MSSNINLEMSPGDYVGVGEALRLSEPAPAFLQFPPDDEVEGGEDEEGRHAGHDDPGPGGVPHCVVLAQPQLGRSSVENLMEATATTGEVHAVSHCLRLEELADVDNCCERDGWEDVAIQRPPARRRQHPDIHNNSQRYLWAFMGILSNLPGVGDECLKETK